MSRREKLALLVRALDEALADLDRYAQEVPFERFVSDRDAYRMVCHALYVAAQATLDIAEVLLTDRRLGPAATYREAIDLLATDGVLEPGLAREIGGWVGLRNVLAHVYTRLDLERLHDACATGLDPLRSFREIAAAEIERPEPPERDQEG